MCQSVLIRHHLWTVLLVSAGIFPAGQPGVVAGEPQVAFDFVRSIACTAVGDDESPEGALAHQVVEARFQVSARVVAGSLADVDEIEVEVRSLTSQLVVDSFSPQTEMSSKFAEPLEKTTTVERTTTLGGSLGGSVSLPAGITAQVTPSVHGGTSRRKAESQSATLVPPKTAAVVSGTLDAGHGVFFKIRPTTQTTLEGTHEFAVRFNVPVRWQADLVMIRCRAKGTKNWLWLKQNREWSTTSNPVAIYLNGRDTARLLAARKMRDFRRKCACTAGG